jgi:RNA polymerase sigma factor (TIGR02999 family)
MSKNSGDITDLLHRWSQGDKEAENELFASIAPQLYKSAQYLMRRERKGHSLQATELVDEAYFRLVAAKDRDWRSRAHFFAFAGRVMRSYLIDHFRGRPKAGFVALDEISNLVRGDPGKIEEALLVHEYLDELEQVNPDWCHAVEVKYFLGLTDEEAADALGIKLRTFQRYWRNARQWLFSRMELSHVQR